MNRYAPFVAFVATIVATLALTGTSAQAGKPPPQPPPDPCIGADSRDFPALAFTRKRTTGGRVYYDRILSDLTGQCQQTVFVSEPFVGPGGGPEQLRYNRSSKTGLMVGNGTGYTYRAFPFAVSFDSAGVPTVTPKPLTSSEILALSSFTTPPDLAADGWFKYVMANASISPDGTKLLAFIAFEKIVNGVQTQLKSYWTCPFSISFPLAPLNASSCTEVFRGIPGDYPNAAWGATGSGSLYITKTSDGGPAQALFLLQLGTTPLLPPTRLWDLGTAFISPSSGLDQNGTELVAVYEGAPTNGCTRILVTNPTFCGGSGCTQLNAAPARTMTWLPNGRLAGEGRTAQNRKGECSATGSIVTFDPYGLNPTTTTIVPVGSSPAGAGRE